jgi:hypothetical protein
VFEKMCEWDISDFVIKNLHLSDELSNTPNGDRMQNLRPQKVDVSTTPIIGPTNLLAFHLPRLGFWMFRVLSFMLYVKKAFEASL